MDNRIIKIPASKRSATLTDQNSYVNLQINSDQRLLPPSNINKVVDVTEQFNIERQGCPYYRIFGKISTLTTNSLFNIDGHYPNENIPSGQKLTSLNGGGYAAFNDLKLRINPDPNSQSGYTYQESISRRLKNVDGWYGYFEPDLSRAGLCSFYQMTPNEKYFSLIEDYRLGLKNWEITVTYPYSADTTHMLINEGILIVDTKEVTVGGKQMIAIGVPVKHNLNVGDLVKIYNTNLESKITYEVKSIGLDNGELKNFYFIISIS